MRKNIGKIIGSAAIAASLLATSGGLALAQNVTGSSTTGTAVSTMTATNTGSTTATSGPAVPGVPNTGAGGDATGTWLLLGASGLIAIGGAWYLMTRRTPATIE